MADSTINGLSSGSTPDGTEEVPVWQSSATAKLTLREVADIAKEFENSAGNVIFEFTESSNNAVLNIKNSTGTNVFVFTANNGLITTTAASGGGFRLASGGFRILDNALSSLFNITQAGQVTIPSLPSYANDAAAGTGGLTQGDLYETDGTGAAPLNVAGILMVKQ